MIILGSTNNANWTYKLEVNEIDTSVQDRTSTVRVQVYLGRASSTSYLGGNYNVSVNCGGQSTSESGNISYPTYISGGDWLLLKTFDFVVPNENNPTTIAISSTLSSNDFTPSYASANGSMQLTILHLNPTIEIAEMVETNQDMIDLNIPDTTIVQYLSKKRITLHATTSDDAIPTYRIEHFNTNYVLPTLPNEYQSSNVFNTDYTQNDVVINNVGKAKIIQRVKDSLNGTASDWLYVTINNEKQEPNGIAYTKPTLEFTSTSIKRKSGNGTNLTDNKANLNLVGTFYKNNDIIGNNNAIINIGYKIWEDNTSEPVSYITIQNPTISGGNISVNDLEISNVIFTKVYKYKIIIVDKYNYSSIVTGKIPIGLATWTEYKDRVDFLAATIGNYPIVESGSNANGNYIKYYDGTMICYKSVTNSIAMTTSWGSLYEGTMQLGDWPEEFISTPNVQVTNVSGTGAMIESFSPSPTTTSAGTVYFARATSYTSDVTVNVLGIGKWK